MLSVQDLHKSYQVGKTTYEGLKGVSLEVAKGEFVAVMGPSGSGKTTLLNCISTIDTVSAGDILLDGESIAALPPRELARFRHAPRFAPAGQSTQMIIGATPESDRHILTLTQALYDKYRLKRVFYSAYMPVSDSALLPARRDFKPPLLREHRLYQADWLLRFYHFRAEELLDEAHPNFNPLVDPKCSWALSHPEFFPVEVNRADYEAPAAGAGYRGDLRPAHPGCPPVRAPHLCGAEKAGGGAQAGPVFPHLRRQVPGGPAGLPRRGAPPPGGPGAAHAGPGRAGAALPLRADGLGGGHGLDTGFLCL